MTTKAIYKRISTNKIKLSLFKKMILSFPTDTEGYRILKLKIIQFDLFSNSH